MQVGSDQSNEYILSVQESVQDLVWVLDPVLVQGSVQGLVLDLVWESDQVLALDREWELDPELGLGPESGPELEWELEWELGLELEWGLDPEWGLGQESGSALDLEWESGQAGRPHHRRGQSCSSGHGRRQAAAAQRSGAPSC